VNGGADVIIVGKCPHLPTSHTQESSQLSQVQYMFKVLGWVEVSAWVDHMGSVGVVPAQLPQQHLQLRHSHNQAFLWRIVRTVFFLLSSSS